MAATRAIEVVERAGIAHRVLSYDATGADGYGREAAAALELDPATVGKTLVAMVDGRPTVAIVPVDRLLGLKSLAAACGAKAAVMAEPAAAERLTGYVVGGISPLGQKRRLPTVVDASLAELATVRVSAGRRGLEIELAGADLVRLTDAVIAAIAT